VPNHNDRALNAIEHVAGWGFTPNIQQRIGALAVIWSLFETNLETTIWALTGENVEGKRPSTDKSSVSTWIEVLPKHPERLSHSAQEVLQVTADAAKDLMDYRHAIMHGSVIPSATMPSFVRNPLWHGQKRGRMTHDAHVSENLLDMAIDCAWVLCKVVFATRSACTDPAARLTLEGMKTEIARVRGMAGELRHLTELMNHEKY